MTIDVNDPIVQGAISAMHLRLIANGLVDPKLLLENAKHDEIKDLERKIRKLKQELGYAD
jgi:hypothetical protein